MSMTFFAQTFSEIPRRGRSVRGRCANLSQIARQICANLPVFMYIRGRVRKIVANLSRIGKSISDNFMQIPLFQCPLLRISDFWTPPQWHGSRISRQTFRTCQVPPQSPGPKVNLHFFWPEQPWKCKSCFSKSALVMTSFEALTCFSKKVFWGLKMGLD